MFQRTSHQAVVRVDGIETSLSQFRFITRPFQTELPLLIHLLRTSLDLLKSGHGYFQLCGLHCFQKYLGDGSIDFISDEELAGFFSVVAVSLSADIRPDAAILQITD